MKACLEMRAGGVDRSLFSNSLQRACHATWLEFRSGCRLGDRLTKSRQDTCAAMNCEAKDGEGSTPLESEDGKVTTTRSHLKFAVRECFEHIYRVFRLVGGGIFEQKCM